MRPSPAVLASFGAGADPVRLPGGQGTTWRAGAMVLKPAGDPRAARWTAGLYLSLSGRRDPGFRVPGPVRSVAGDWIAGDRDTGEWVAWRWRPGEPADWSGRSPFWPRLIAASRAFHAALAGWPAPPWLGIDGSQWTIGDQVAWGDRDPGSVLAAAPAPLDGQLRSLLAALRPVDLPDQLIHGDLGGNVLFADGQPPVVIDFSPYWRPAGLALAVAAVDALTWDGADPAILGPLAGQAGTGPGAFGQLLARAQVYRLVTEVVARRDDPAGLGTVARAARPVTGLILDHLAVR
jgi:prepilin-type processing-associated H-X9-DG protein